MESPLRFMKFYMIKIILRSVLSLNLIKNLRNLILALGWILQLMGSYLLDTRGVMVKKYFQKQLGWPFKKINVTEDMAEEFELGLILYGKNGETWYFSTQVEKISSIHKIPVQHSQNVDGLNLEITEVSFSETGVNIAYESSEEETDLIRSQGGYIEFLVVDQDGNEITGRTGGASGERVKDKIVFKSRKQFDPLDSNVTELTITPYLVIPSDGGGVEI